MDHGGIDDATRPGLPRLHHRREDPECQVHPAPAEIGDQVQRRARGPVGFTQEAEHAGKAEIIDVMPTQMGQRPRLPPACHPGVDQFRVQPGAIGGAETETFHLAGPEPFHQHIRLGDQRHRVYDPRLGLQVERHIIASPVQERRRPGARARPRDAGDARAKI